MNKKMGQSVWTNKRSTEYVIFLIIEEDCVLLLKLSGIHVNVD